MNLPLPDPVPIKDALFNRCPRCHEGRMFQPGWQMEPYPHCTMCELDLQDKDVGDGPAVFLIFILGFVLVPLALWVEFAIGMPLWLHATLWTILALGITLGSLRPLKGYILALEYKHRPWDRD